MSFLKRLISIFRKKRTKTTTTFIGDGKVKLALCCGINKYPNPANNLRGCVNDANDLSEMFFSMYGFNDTKIIVFGVWGIGKQTKMKNFISTPNLGLKRKLNEYFKVYSIDEFRTSQLNYKTEEICENLVLPDKKGVKREMHSILTFKMENKRLGCINRDKNSINNMKKLTDYFLVHKDRPEKYKRTTKLIKVTNHINKVVK